METATTARPVETTKRERATGWTDITEKDATVTQTSAGFSLVTEAKVASTTLIKALKSLTVNKGSIEKVETALTSATAGTSDAESDVTSAVTAFLALPEANPSRNAS